MTDAADDAIHRACAVDPPRIRQGDRMTATGKYGRGDTMTAAAGRFRFQTEIRLGIEVASKFTADTLHDKFYDTAESYCAAADDRMADLAMTAHTIIATEMVDRDLPLPDGGLDIPQTIIDAVATTRNNEDNQNDHHRRQSHP
jgi:hypothetical protein